MEMTRQEILRREAGMTKQQLAEKAGLQPNVVGWIERGRWIPYDGQLEKIAAALGVDDPQALLEKVEAE